MARIGYWVIKYSCDLLYSWSKRTEVMGCGIGFQPVIVRSYRPAVLPAYQSTVGKDRQARMPIPHQGRRMTGRMPIPPRKKNDRQDAYPTLRKKNDRQGCLSHMPSTDATHAKDRDRRSYQKYNRTRLGDGREVHGPTIRDETSFSLS